MQPSFKLSLGLVLTALLSTSGYVSASQTVAAPAARSKTKIIAGTAAGLTITALVAIIISNYNLRKPADRFDAKKFKEGDLKTKLKHAWYLISDRIIGWPYKPNKLTIVRNADGKLDVAVNEKQYPGGLFGKFDAHVLFGFKKALEFPAKALASLLVIGAAANWTIDQCGGEQIYWTAPFVTTPAAETVIVQ